MAVSIGLKRQVDLPVWEWCRFSPVATNLITVATTQDDGRSRYIYCLFGATGLFRYDTVSDGWQQLTSPAIVPAATAGYTASLKHQTYNGLQCYALDAQAIGTGALRCMGLNGQALVGKTLRVMRGKGKGQERTVTGVTAATTHVRGVASSGSALVLTDNTKAWAVNQWRNHQVRVHHFYGVPIVRRILHNDATSLTFASLPWCAVESRSYAPAATSISAGAQYSIESTTFTVDSNWTEALDETSRIVFNTSVLWEFHSVAAAPFFAFQAYSCEEDVWYAKSQPSSFFLAFPTPDSSMERFGTIGGIFETGTSTSGSTKTLTDTAKAWAVNRWANYRLTVTSGAAKGQRFTIRSNTPDTITTWQEMPVAVSTCTYQIDGDGDKVHLMTAGRSSMMQYSQEADAWTFGPILDWGTASNLSCRYGEQVPFVLSGITRVGSMAMATTAAFHNLKAGDSVTIYGATGADGALYNGTFTVAAVSNSTLFTYVMAGTPTANASSVSGSFTTVYVDVSKNWTPGELVGKMVYLLMGGGYATTAVQKMITANDATSFTMASGSVGSAGARYVIQENAALGAEAFGTATSGSATTIVDTTKSWGVNAFVGYQVQVLGGAGAGNVATITSNTATTLTFASITGLTIDTSSIYAVFGCPPRQSGFELCWTSGATPEDGSEDWLGRYVYSFRGGALPGLDRYDIPTMRWEHLHPAPLNEAFGAGSNYCYDGGNSIIIQRDNLQRFYRYDIRKNTVEPLGQAPYVGGSVIPGNRMEIVETDDGLKYLYFMRHSGQEMFRVLLWWF